MITYQSYKVKMPNFSKREVNKWIKTVANTHNKIIGDIGYLFCDDEKILEVNREFLNHDYYTDIITFDYCINNIISGDIVISLDTVKSNSIEQHTPYEQELFRVIIHGILHLCGINDKGPGEREIMEAEENKALHLLPNY